MNFNTGLINIILINTFESTFLFCAQFSPYTIDMKGEGLGLLMCDTPGIGWETGKL